MPSERFSGHRPELMAFIVPNGLSILDVGCGGGRLAVLLRRAGARRVVGIEYDQQRAVHAASLPEGPHLVISSSVEDVLEKATLGVERFDLIVLADVLEHLVDPWSVLDRLVEMHLKPAGQVLICVPNMASLPVIKQLLLRRDWPYHESGLFDRTHLRQFGATSFEQLLSSAHLHPVVWGGMVSLVLKGRLGYSRMHTNVRRFPKIAVTQFYVLAELDCQS